MTQYLDTFRAFSVLISDFEQVFVNREHRFNYILSGLLLQNPKNGSTSEQVPRVTPVGNIGGSPTYLAKFLFHVRKS